MLMKSMITNLQVEACISILKIEKHKKKIWWINEIKNDNHKIQNNEVNIDKKKNENDVILSW